MRLTEIIPCQITQWHPQQISSFVSCIIFSVTSQFFFPSEIYCRLQTATKKSNLWKQDSQAVTSSPFKMLMFRCLLAIINMLNLDALRLEDALIVLSLKNVQYAPSTKWIIPPNSKIWKEKISRYVIKQMLWWEQKKTSYPNPINMQRGNLVISLRCERAWYQH